MRVVRSAGNILRAVRSGDNIPRAVRSDDNILRAVRSDGVLSRAVRSDGSLGLEGSSQRVGAWPARGNEQAHLPTCSHNNSTRGSGQADRR